MINGSRLLILKDSFMAVSFNYHVKVLNKSRHWVRKRMVLELRSEHNDVSAHLGGVGRLNRKCAVGLIQREDRVDISYNHS